MSDAGNGLEKRHEILLQKYKTLRRNHRNLAGVALRLAEALEAFLKDDGKPDVRSIVLSCLTMYPSLAKEESVGDPSTERSESVVVAEVVANEDEAKESESPEKEYFQGFWSKPKIPRTPLV